MKLLFAIAVLHASVLGAADLTIESPAVFEDQKLEMRVVSGAVKLPAEGRWSLLGPAAESGLEQAYLKIENLQALSGDGARKREMEIEEALTRGQWTAQSQLMMVRSFAETHQWHGPRAWDDPEFLDTVPNYGRPWPQNRQRNSSFESNQLANFHTSIENLGLIPSVEFPPLDNGAPAPKSPDPVILELAPPKDDGKHWVVYTDGSVKRVPIDTNLLARYNLVISKSKMIRSEPLARPAEQLITIYALARQKPGALVPVKFKDARSSRILTAAWDLRQPAPAQSSSLKAWAELRALDWQTQAGAGEPTFVNTWLQLGPTLYGAGTGNPLIRQNGFIRNEMPSLASLLGGRAAAQETLQIQALRMGGRGFGNKSLSREVALANIPGVDVKSHPFAEMIKGKTCAPIALANYVPRDRGFLYAAKPGCFADLFGTESAFVARSSAFGPTAGLDYRLLDRYTQDLGLTPAIRDMLLKNSSVLECALFVPDLFFADGTDITLIVRMDKSSPLTQLLRPMLSLTASAKDGISSIPASKGNTAFWTVRDDLWFASTRRSELSNTLALHTAKGEGSLGTSDEFRYMLNKLPLTPNSRAYIYLSDPFIRRLVGPEVKIAQTRRVAAQAQMEQLLAGALLRKLDQPEGKISSDKLAGLGYIPAQSSANCELKDDFTVESAPFGSLGRLKPLSAQELTQATPEEAAAYKAYIDSYSQFWRQYFDPIAMRLDCASDNQYTLATFILPLIDSTIYSAIRDWLPKEGRPSRVPEFSTPPVGVFSLALSDEGWTKISRELSRLVENYIGLSPEFYDLLGPALHVAVTDANPVVRLGGRDLASLFPATLGGGMGQGALIYAPVLLNVLTRPTTIAVELTNSARARQLLEQAAARRPGAGADAWVGVQFYQIENQPAWILSLRLIGVASIDFELRVENNYLVIANQPWGEINHVTGSRPLALDGAALTLDTRALKVSLPALFAGEAEAERDRTFGQMAYLYPWMAALRSSAQEALKHQSSAMGFCPVIDAGDISWRDGELFHAKYGSPTERRQPAHRAGSRFGLLDGVDTAALEMQFEDDGLRTLISWALNSPTSTAAPK